MPPQISNYNLLTINKPQLVQLDNPTNYRYHRHPLSPIMLITSRSHIIPVQVFAGLLLVLGILSGKSEGLKCYSCDGNGCDKPDKSVSKDCAAGETACFKSGLKGSMKRGCYSKVATNCYRNTGHGSCYPLNSFHVEEVHQCLDIGNTVTGTSNTTWFEGGSICVCKGDLCNDGPAKPIGLKCFVSTPESKNCHANCAATQICAQGEQCLRRVDYSGVTVERACFEAEASQCFRRKYGTCQELGRNSTYAGVLNYLSTCAGYHVRGGEDRNDFGQFQGHLCVCDTTLCNPAPSPASGSKFTLAIILSITAVYNHLRGLTYF